tara:strand:+ start:352 stop:1284 length:933 start_codon:yes stop_codon:yes gene_type:complete
MGFMGINVAEKYGGIGLGNLEAIIVSEEFSKLSTALAFPIFESCVGPVKAIEHFANEDLRQRVLPAVCRGEALVAVSMSEPQAGSALTDLTTHADLRNDKIIRNGQKRWCSGGGHSDGYVVYCRMSDEPGAKGIGAVYVEKGTLGLSFGKREQLMGFRGVLSADIVFDNVELPLENQIVPAGIFRQLMETFDLERCENSTTSLGLAVGAFESALEYVVQRHQFGKPIIEFQAVQMKLAQMAMRIEASRLLIYRAIANAGKGLPSMFESYVPKCFANEITREVCGTALQLFGAYGYSKEFRMEQRFRDAWG